MNSLFAQPHLGAFVISGGLFSGMVEAFTGTNPIGCAFGIAAIGCWLCQELSA